MPELVYLTKTTTGSDLISRRRAQWPDAISHTMNLPRVTVSLIYRWQMRYFLLASFVVIVPVDAINTALADTQIRIELFTTTDLQFIELVDEEEGSSRSINLQVYELNGIQLVEAELSRNLTADPAQSKRILLQRIQELDEQTRKRMQRSATGLARAMQYGIDRYPAIVINGHVIVYGVTDLNTALSQYQSWLVGNNP